LKTITIHKTKHTPEVVINYYRDTFSIEGESVPEDAAEFYTHVLEEFKKYKETKSEVLFIINLESLNAGSIKCLLTLFKEASTNEGNFQKARVEWFFPKNDKALKQSGEVFEHISKLKFVYKEKDKS